ncbi:hypothetical protein LguiB_010546 [Lonicera macranthoides]
MAGLTHFPFKPLIPFRPKHPLSISSFHLHHNPNNNNNNNNNSSNLSLVLSVPRPYIAARYGGEGFSRSEPSDSYDDQDLDMSIIGSENVRLIDEKQNMVSDSAFVGIVSKSVAVQMAEDVELDLVIVSPDVDPPVVKIMDYNYNIDIHDYSVRLKAAKKFLKDGDKVKVIVNLKGRENEFRNTAIELLKRFQNDIGELAVEESKNFRDKNINLVLAPNKVAIQKFKELPKKKENSTAADLVSKYGRKTA